MCSKVTSTVRYQILRRLMSLHQAVQLSVQVRRPAAGKRKAAEAAQAVPEGVSAHDLANDEPAGLPLELTATDNSPEAANTGPMTKAKKRKGMTQPPSTPPALAVL